MNLDVISRQFVSHYCVHGPPVGFQLFFIIYSIAHITTHDIYIELKTIAISLDRLVIVNIHHFIDSTTLYNYKKNCIPISCNRCKILLQNYLDNMKYYEKLNHIFQALVV